MTTPNTAKRYHCNQCVTEWYGFPECFLCGLRGAFGATPNDPQHGAATHRWPTPEEDGYDEGIVF